MKTRSMMSSVEMLSGEQERTGEVVADALIYSLSSRGPRRVASSSRYQVDGGRVATSQGRQLRADPLQRRAHREAMTGWELGSSHHEGGSGNCGASSTPWRARTEYGWRDTTTEQTKSQIGLGIGTAQVPAPEMTLALAPETTAVPKLTVVGVESSPVPSWLTRRRRHAIRD